MKKFIFVVIGLCVGVSNVYAVEKWVKNPSYGAWDYQIDGTVVGTYLSVLQVSQPTTYTCGATTLSMLLIWECQKKGYNNQYYNRMQIHKIMNTSGGETSGLTTEELKKGIPIIVNYVRNVDRIRINVNMRERKNYSIRSAINFLSNQMQRNDSPAILYGNVKYGSAGGHYYIVTGVFNCNNYNRGFCRTDYNGFYLNDSVYGSRAYSAYNPVKINAISTRKYISEDELASYWKPTGSKFFWLRKHIFLYNKSSRT